MIKEENASSIDELCSLLNRLPNNYIYRGQANASWGLLSGLERVLGDTWSKARARRFEDYSRHIFQSKYHIYNDSEHTPATRLGWLSVMQHYGVPTRLIDFTTSPYIAMYFALETYDPAAKSDFAIYAIDYRALLNRSIGYVRSKDSKFSETSDSLFLRQDNVYEDVLDRYSHDIAWVGEPTESNARIERQSGTFLISGTLEHTIENILNADLYDGVDMRKIRVPARLYEGCYVALRKMSINSKALYGDLFGLARSIRMDFSAHV